MKSVTKAVLIGDRNPTDDRTYDTDKSLIRPADKQVSDWCRSVNPFNGRPIDGSVVVPGEAGGSLSE